ncbi:ABC transporter ATP-binding protein [Mycobacterium sp. 21AC1]|uniref:ABC transporter ATP-binding protein n=1 Tax=[Mycobacterium] appelbergii TaxID=2939269 RepID=UPI002938FA42|nr:ABC transporter ATP-binding protein [Mycobacterium sp. 21AC1]MDV3128406.1 ABC transporter ATP-binding protein [Mycobacterium sp. 21AC1]
MSIQDTTHRLRVNGVSKSYGGGSERVDVLADISADILDGELLCIVGPSGAGKTTLLRCLTGLMPPTAGSISLDGEQLRGPDERISIVFQDYTRSLFPWMTVSRNIELPLRARGVQRQIRRQRVARVLDDVGLAATEKKYPWQLSGGMQQRVAIARALVTEPEVLVMDEPFASVDAQTRLELEDLTLTLKRDQGVTVVVVTHDIDEAVYMSDRIVVLSKNPATVQEIVSTDFGPDRNQFETREDPRFGELRSHILALIRTAQLKVT